MLYYYILGDNQWGAAPGHHDDVVTAWMLALLSAHDEGSIAQEPIPLPIPPKRKDPITFLDMDKEIFNTSEEDEGVVGIGFGGRRRWT